MMDGKYRHLRWHKSRALLYATVALAAMPAAFAQQTQSTPTDEIVVTASKRSENIQDVPSAVSAVSNTMLQDLHALQLTDIGSYVPALQINSAGTPGQTSISIRGIAPVGPGATVGTYIDDTPIGSSSAYGGGISFALDLLPYDVERVEVLRGPQGTLYGASSMGGLLKYVLTSPAMEAFDTHVGADTFIIQDASRPGGGARASVTGPLIEGTLGMTASYAQENTPGFIDSPLTGSTDQNGYRQQSGRLGFLFKPTDNLSFKLDALYQRIDAGGDATVSLDPTSLQPLINSRSDANLEGQPFRKYIQYYSAILEDKFSWADFVSATSYSDTSTHQTTDDSNVYGIAFPAFGLPFAGKSQAQYNLHLDKYSQEFRLQAHPDATFEWLVGAFFTYEKSSNFQSPSALDPQGNPIPGLDPIYTARLPSTYTENAVFGDVTFHVTDKFEILGGVRYSTNYQVFSTVATSAVLTPVDSTNNKSSDSVATFNAGARYRWTDDLMTYVRVASGYQPGGPNLPLPGVDPVFHPDTLTNYEVGLKSKFWDKKLLLDIDAFYIGWNDIQLLSNGAGFSAGVNGGTAKSEGIELNTSVRPIIGLTFDATFSYIDAVLTQDVPALNGLSGDRLPNIPRLSGSLRATYTGDISDEWVGRFGAGLRAQDERVSDVNHAFDSRSLPGYAALDLNVSASNDRYTIGLYAKNVTNTHAYLTYNPLINQATGAISQIEASVLQPRVIGLSIDADF